MAIISEIEDARPSMLPFHASFDPSNPLGFLEKALDFIGKESNFLMKDMVEKEIVAAAVVAKKRLREAEKKNKAKNESVKPTEKNPKKETVEPMKPKEEEKQESGPIVTKKGNGLDFEKYSWTQNLQEVMVNIPLPNGTKTRSVSCEIKKNSLKVSLKGKDPIIEGELFHNVKLDECFWNIEDQQVISVLLTKQDQMKWWKYCVKGEPEVDTQKLEPETIKLADLDPESRSTIEKVMFEERQKRKGLPTSDEVETEDMLKKFMAQNPMMDFTELTDHCFNFSSFN